ncbi:MAG: histidinol-phosphatase [Gammaproteobacteria bacterium]|nr:histidinol-phosphatase [Gammaproteobacteria bacterium]
MSREEEIQLLTDFVTDIARDSGEIALKYFRSDLKVENKQSDGKFDPVTLADTEIEAFLRDKISAKYPGHSIVGEEEGETRGSEPFKWFIDPIDGTRGFVAGSPMWGTLVGVMENDLCVAGVMNQPFLNETFVGSETGAFLINNQGKKQIKCSETEKISDAVLCCTHLSMFHTGKALDRFVRIAESCRFSRFGTDCYGYGMLAHGFVDLIVESSLKSFDIMALIPIVEAAGGVVSNWQGDSVAMGGDVVAAATPALHEQALKFLSA